MKLRKGHLNIYYDGKGEYELEKNLRELLESHGYKFWASGFNLVDEVRDLAFEKKSGK